jgi:probable HAF family extracellular repeat protein
MSSMLSRLSWTSGLVALAAFTGLTTLQANSQPKEFVFGSFDVQGNISAAPQGINDRGDIVGNLFDAQGVRHGFLLRRGEAVADIIDYPQAIGGPAGSGTAATGINAQGDVVGWYRLPGEASNPLAAHGYLLSRKGVFTRIDYPGHLNTMPQRITSTGIALGCYHDTDGMDSMHGFTRSPDGSFSGFSVPASMHNGASPDGSRIAGLYQNHGYVIDQGGFLSFDVPDSIVTAAYDMTPQGDVIGHFRDGSGRFHGFLRDEDGEFTVLDYPGASSTQARGINAQGEVVGFYDDANGRRHGFLAQPVRER